MNWKFWTVVGDLVYITMNWHMWEIVLCSDGIVSHSFGDMWYASIFNYMNYTCLFVSLFQFSINCRGCTKPNREMEGWLGIMSWECYRNISVETIFGLINFVLWAVISRTHGMTCLPIPIIWEQYENECVESTFIQIPFLLDLWCPRHSYIRQISGSYLHQCSLIRNYGQGNTPFIV